MTYDNPNPRRFVVIVDLDEDDLDASDFTIDDIEDALAARLGPEACFDEGGNPVHGRLVAAARVEDAYEDVWKALLVGSDVVEGPNAETLEVMGERLRQGRQQMTARY